MKPEKNTWKKEDGKNSKINCSRIWMGFEIVFLVFCCSTVEKSKQHEKNDFQLCYFFSFFVLLKQLCRVLLAITIRSD